MWGAMQKEVGGGRGKEGEARKIGSEEERDRQKISIECPYIQEDNIFLRKVRGRIETK